MWQTDVPNICVFILCIGWIDPTDKCWRVDSECEYFMNDIVAWQPLPKPYEEKAR